MDFEILKNLIDKLEEIKSLSKEEWESLLSAWESVDLREYAAQKAVAIRKKVYKNYYKR